MKKSFVFIFTVFMGLLFVFASHPGPKLVNLKDLDLKSKPMDTQAGGSVKPDIIHLPGGGSIERGFQGVGGTVHKFRL
jgi:hypothetical protein